MPPAAGAPGTRVEVRDLFFAAPARRKFLKHPRAEADQARGERCAAWRWPGPPVGFRAANGRPRGVRLPPQERDARIHALLGADFAAAALPVAAEGGGLLLAGLAAQPAYTRATGTGQHLVVNRRPVRDPLLRTALRVAYRDLIAVGRHPVAALFLDMPPEAVDVNVHPMKTELRFRDEAAVRGLLIGAAAGALGRRRVAAPALPAPRPRARLVALAASAAGPCRPLPRPRPGRDATGARRRRPAAAAHARARLRPAPAAAGGGVGRRATIRSAAPVAQVLDTYILAEAPDGALVLVDQHAAHERLTHEALRAQLLDGGVRAQPLLLPAVVDLPPADAARLLGFAAPNWPGSAWRSRRSAPARCWSAPCRRARLARPGAAAARPGGGTGRAATRPRHWTRGWMRRWRGWPAMARSAPGGG